MKSKKKHQAEFDKIIANLKNLHELELHEPFNAYEGIKSISDSKDDFELTKDDEKIFLKNLEKQRERLAEKSLKYGNTKRSGPEYIHAVGGLIQPLEEYSEIMIKQIPPSEISAYEIVPGQSDDSGLFLDVRGIGSGSGNTGESTIQKTLSHVYVYHYQPNFIGYKDVELGAYFDFNGFFQYSVKQGSSRGVQFWLHITTWVERNNVRIATKGDYLINYDLIAPTSNDSGGYNFSDIRTLYNTVGVGYGTSNVKVYVRIQIHALARSNTDYVEMDFGSSSPYRADPYAYVKVL